MKKMGKCDMDGSMMKMTSHMPKGASLSPKGDLGAQRAAEARAAFKKGLAGKPMSSGLPFRKPDTGIDRVFGPGDKVC